MKAKHVTEASNLIAQYNRLNNQLFDIDLCPKITLGFGKNAMSVSEGDEKYPAIKAACITVIEHNINNLKRRCAQIGLVLD